MTRKDVALAIAAAWDMTAGRADVNLELLMDLLAERKELYEAFEVGVKTRRSEIAKEGLI